MNGFLPMLRKEFIEVFRTWRIWLVGGLFAFFGVADPIIALFTPEILAMAIGGATPINVPEATWMDAWAQWARDLSQLLLIIVIVVAAGTVAGEVSSGTAIMPLTKPVDRHSFVLAKFTAVTGLVLGSAVLGTGLASATTAIAFRDADFGSVWRAIAVWAVLAVFLIAVTILGSCLVPSTVAAFGIGFGVYMVMSIVAIWQPATVYSPIGLQSAVVALARGEHADLGWPVVTGLAGTVVFLLLAIWVFRRRDL